MLGINDGLYLDVDGSRGSESLVSWIIRSLGIASECCDSVKVVANVNPEFDAYLIDIAVGL